MKGSNNPVNKLKWQRRIWKMDPLDSLRKWELDCRMWSQKLNCILCRLEWENNVCVYLHVSVYLWVFMWVCVCVCECVCGVGEHVSVFVGCWCQCECEWRCLLEESVCECEFLHVWLWVRVVQGCVSGNVCGWFFRPMSLLNWPPVGLILLFVTFSPSLVLTYFSRSSSSSSPSSSSCCEQKRVKLSKMTIVSLNEYDTLEDFGWSLAEPIIVKIFFTALLSLALDGFDQLLFTF